MAMGQKALPDNGPEQEKEKKKLDLSAAQVAGSSLATVAAALLASQMGVYGTILGAGVVSVVATAGGPVIQHFFRRTGDQLRESARPKSRQVEVEGPRGEPRGARVPDGTMVLRQGAPPQAGISEEFGEATVHGKFGEATVHGSRVRGRKRTAIASALAFAIALGGIGAYEAVADTSVSKGGGTVFSGGTRKAGNDRPAAPEGGTGGGTGGAGAGGKSPETGSSPSSPHPKGSPSPSPDPDSSPSPGTSPSPTPPKPDPTPSPTPPTSPTPGTGQATPGGGGSTGPASTPTP
ncbi:hypothetical protein J7E97_13565 [Streptomyces sp. ISL-66]|uniref:hypothetical protein n=1 Tax=Streptomyces sp. ISL-66 TaxID=2819186 RepID=UPI001BE9928B|nr:hypothetical protein [Streptomyces sp. ISL-66]MBT2468876.1 hypothetical protein [Streptomyces sp. ISL-66]